LEAFLGSSVPAGQGVLRAVVKSADGAMIESIVSGLQCDASQEAIRYAFDRKAHSLSSRGEPTIGDRATVPARVAKELSGGAVIEIVHSCIWGRRGQITSGAEQGMICRLNVWIALPLR
jgi:hypothetical protein